MRPPAAGEDEARWLERAREAEARGPFGLHTHWTAPDHARPTEGMDPAGLVREQGSWLRSVGLEATLFCGGGWYFDERVADAVADLGYADCTATAFRPAYLADDAPHLQLEEPTWLELAGGRRLLELPTTHSVGMLARGIFARSSAQQVVHAYFHDTDLLDGGARRRCVWGSVSSGAGGRRRTSASFSVACVPRRRCRSRTSAREAARGVRR